MMFIGISIILCSLFYSILVLVVFFAKERIKSKETDIYRMLLISNILNLIFELGCFYTISISSKIPIITAVVSKLFLLALLNWNVLFSIYMFYISLVKVRDFNKKINKILGFELILYIISVGFIAIAPLYYFYENNTMYSYGMGADFVTLVFGLNMVLTLVSVCTNIKKIQFKKTVPMFILTFLTGLCVAIRLVEPGLNILSATMSFITLLMYFTIENPDVKLINELELAKRNAERANNAKTEFLSSMSHEIRTPLNAIVGFSNSIMEDNSLEEAKEEARDIIMASNNLLEIVNGILDISKIEAGKMEIVNVNYKPNKIFKDLIKLVKPRIGEKPIELKTNFSSDIPGVLFGDGGKVREIISNLLTNACKYTEKGIIDFSVSCINEKDICKLVISVEDTGRGIKPEKIDKLFTKFNRLDEDKNTTLEGTGLGLAITKNLVEMMGGKIIVQSKYGSGSKFTVYLSQKIVSIFDNEVEEVKEEELEIDYSNKRVLVVDDNNLNIKVSIRLLRNYKIVPDVCVSGFECLEMVNKNKYDLILLDDMMPKMSGVETFNKLKEDKGFDTPVVILTANAISGMREKYIKEGFSDYLAKPIDKLELKRVLDEYLGKKIK